MHDNKLRLSADVLEKAELIANEWGLKNPRAAVEAVFRKYADEYLYGRIQGNPMMVMSHEPVMPKSTVATPACEASSELDGLLGL